MYITIAIVNVDICLAIVLSFVPINYMRWLVFPGSHKLLALFNVFILEYSYIVDIHLLV